MFWIWQLLETPLVVLTGQHVRGLWYCRAVGGMGGRLELLINIPECTGQAQNIKCAEVKKPCSGKIPSLIIGLAKKFRFFHKIMNFLANPIHRRQLMWLLSNYTFKKKKNHSFFHHSIILIHPSSRIHSLESLQRSARHWTFLNDTNLNLDFDSVSW